MGPWARHLSRELRAAAAGDEQAGDAGQRDGAWGGDEGAVDRHHVPAERAGSAVGAGGASGEIAAAAWSEFGHNAEDEVGVVFNTGDGREVSAAVVPNIARAVGGGGEGVLVGVDEVEAAVGAVLEAKGVGRGVAVANIEGDDDVFVVGGIDGELHTGGLVPSANGGIVGGLPAAVVSEVGIAAACRSDAGVATSVVAGAGHAADEAGGTGANERQGGAGCGVGVVGGAVEVPLGDDGSG